VRAKWNLIHEFRSRHRVEFRCKHSASAGKSDWPRGVRYVEIADVVRVVARDAVRYCFGKVATGVDNGDRSLPRSHREVE
jgi:hypothetical protein